MRTKLDYRSLGESKGTFSSASKSSHNATNSSIREKKEEKKHRRDKSSMASSGATGIAMGILAGAGVGVLAGILMAPDKGSTTRRRLSDSAAWVGRGITETLHNSKGKMNSWIGRPGEMNQGSRRGWDDRATG